MHMRGFDYLSDKRTQSGGMTRLATLMRDLRETSEANGDVVVAVDNGDSLQGTPLEELALRERGEPHVFYRALSVMKYDAAGLGNHDFNFGLDHLAASVRAAHLPILCSNARRIDGSDLPVESWTILRRHMQGIPLNIGVFSLLPPQTLVWDADHLAGHLIVDDIVTSARTAIAELQTAGCDIIICLAHTGLGEPEAVFGQENALWPLSKLEDVDAIVAGHTHLLLPDPDAPDHSDTSRGILNGTPVVMPGTGGDHLGVIDLELSHSAAGWQVVSATSQLRAVSGPEDIDLTKMTAPLHKATQDLLARRAGLSPVHLHSYFSFLVPSPALALVAAAKAHALRAHTSGDFDLPLLSCAAPTKMGGRGGPQCYLDIPGGPLSLRHVYDLCFFPNRLAAVVVTGAELVDWIEMSAGIYNRVEAHQPDQILFDPRRPAHSSDVIYGVQYELDLSQPSRFDEQGQLMDPRAHRVKTLKHRGRKVKPGDRFIVALSSYRANGGGNVHALKTAERLDIPSVLIRDALRDYLSEGLFPDGAYESSFHFSSLNETWVTAQTGPGARRFLDEIDCMRAEDCGLDQQGFLNLRLCL